MTAFTKPTAIRLLLWCVFTGALVQLLLWRWADYERFTPIFRYLLRYYDSHGNLLLAALAVCAWFLRRQPAALAAVRFAADRPWTIAAVLFPILCLGSLQAYHNHPLSMDEYAAVFQAKVFAAGRLAGAFPPELLDWLIPPYFQNGFLVVSRVSGEVSSIYWPGFALLLAPFAWLGIPWALNPALGALVIPALHRLTRQVTESQETAGWAVALTVASPAFIVASISFYSMQAHLLSNLLFALLLLHPTVPRALLAGLVGSVALTLHQPVPHLLFLLPFALWLIFRPGSVTILAALCIGYLPLSILLGFGWHYHLLELMHGTIGGGSAPSGAPLLDVISARIGNVVRLPSPVTIEARIAGLSKLWTWGALGLLVLAAYGYAAGRTLTAVRILGAALALTFFGYFLLSVEQGHGWGYRYIHSAWFVMPLLAAIALSPSQDPERGELRGMVAWAIVLSLVLVNAQRLVQVESFMDRHLRQVPPLVSAPDPARREIVFVDPAAGSYLEDVVQNDPFLRAPRIVMMLQGRENVEDLMRRRFPGYERSARGEWGELWVFSAGTASPPR